MCCLPQPEFFDGKVRLRWISSEKKDNIKLKYIFYYIQTLLIIIIVIIIWWLQEDSHQPQEVLKTEWIETLNVFISQPFHSLLLLLLLLLLFAFFIEPSQACLFFLHFFICPTNLFFILNLFPMTYSRINIKESLKVCSSNKFEGNDTSIDISIEMERKGW